MILLQTLRFNTKLGRDNTNKTLSNLPHQQNHISLALTNQYYAKLTQKTMGNILSASFAEECTPAKQKYDDCFNHWYSEKFLKGKSMENECEDLWVEYQQCVEVHLIKKGIKPMLDEARSDAPFEKGGVPLAESESKK
ncbi:unnamed protein product [Kuraishia capsulata CBS 1993]|uniref:Mitochondrial distribution and morphology protein 35 n=1 Tax=Kuraishia capsulata CBS 1993 TaxID=1382522 RepID=W6MPZ3_9ASCO|nr:uncharacterized protein KUCA_T00004779001 [Kuraishia capsulata CBS 1993]CDK28794.1 unnamed protein product [Kuraishia capsulata CBS 1993]